ncbi:hypothetical protein RRG08_028332 [Elysia crispata]|uniref:Uncharacterized protein n=1 Tax=Elysia crispata TaxID=231223 RepID=A0AAE1AXM0_9GAST|nr:hypothetical protein RRG08_028332 [Elysia crispata]
MTELSEDERDREGGENREKNAGQIFCMPGIVIRTKLSINSVVSCHACALPIRRAEIYLDAWSSGLGCTVELNAR